jgi:SLA1 Homology Domain 1 (SHD1) protein
MPATLKPRQTSDPAVTAAPQTHETHNLQPAPTTIHQPARPTAPQHAVESPPSAAATTATTTPKSPAKPAVAKPTDAVAPPAFPPVDDDPFAPLPPAAKVPPTTQPNHDDPFAPINPTPALPPRSAPPVVAEPTSKFADPIAIGADGQLPLRGWSDNSGQFQVKARLILILDGKVRLLKETGRTTTVPNERLSTADRQYIDEVIARYGKDLTTLDQFALR